jgi:flagellum-specific peptidoglycan hydrolase FlgJ
MNQEIFIAKIAAAAVADYKDSKVLPSITIAQAILESSWGDSGLTAKANNLFGIKGKGPAGSVTMATKEHVGGKIITVDAAFRKYNTWAESIADHSKLLQNKRYAAVLTARDGVTAAYAIKAAGYATDVNYPKLLIDIINKYKLYQYDVEAQKGAEFVDKIKTNLNGKIVEGAYLFNDKSYIPASMLPLLGIQVSFDDKKVLTLKSNK